MSERQPLLQHDGEQATVENVDRKRRYVTFNLEGDEEDPLQWSKRYRYGVVSLLFLMAFNV